MTDLWREILGSANRVDCDVCFSKDLEGSYPAMIGDGRATHVLVQQGHSVTQVLERIVGETPTRIFYIAERAAETEPAVLMNARCAAHAPAAADIKGRCLHQECNVGRR